MDGAGGEEQADAETAPRGGGGTGATVRGTGASEQRGGSHGEEGNGKDGAVRTGIRHTDAQGRDAGRAAGGDDASDDELRKGRSGGQGEHSGWYSACDMYRPGGLRQRLRSGTREGERMGIGLGDKQRRDTRCDAKYKKKRGTDQREEASDTRGRECALKGDKVIGRTGGEAFLVIQIIRDKGPPGGGRRNGRVSRPRERRDRRQKRDIMSTRWPDLGIPWAPDTGETRSFHEWLEHDTQVDQRVMRGVNTIEAKLAQWEAHRCNTNAVVCISRADRELKKWTKRSKQRKRDGDDEDQELQKTPRAPPAGMLQGQLHTTVLPTAIASKTDRYYLVDKGRHMSARETANAMGYRPDGRLKAVIGTTHKETGRLPAGARTEMQAIAMQNEGMHVPTLRAVLRSGMPSMAHSERKVRLYDMCSGIGTMAEAVDQETGGNMEVVGAAERDARKRSILQEVWQDKGLKRARIYVDALGEDAADGPEADVFGMTPDCGKWSSASTVSEEEAMAETGKVKLMMRYATRKRPRMVVLESVATLLGNGRMRRCGEAIEAALRGALPDYTWRAQIVDPWTHIGAPMRRERAFWVGTRPTATAQQP